MLLGLACLALPGIAEAHPHVWITVTEELVYAPDGTIAALRQIWTFDDMFSAFSIRGIEQKTPGTPTRDELEPLTKEQLEGLRDYAYFTHPKLDGQPQRDAFGDPVDFFLEFDPKQAALTLHFTLPFKAPMEAKSFEVDIFDPQLFFYLSFAAMAPVRLIGAPAQCTLFAGGDRSEHDGADSDHIAGIVATATRQIVVKCRES